MWLLSTIVKSHNLTLNHIIAIIIIIIVRTRSARIIRAILVWLWTTLNELAYCVSGPGPTHTTSYFLVVFFPY